MFFLNDTATPEIYTLSLHDALPIWEDHDGHQARCNLPPPARQEQSDRVEDGEDVERPAEPGIDRKSTRLNSSHANIPYAVFCLQKQLLEPTQSYITSRLTVVLQQIT